MIEEGERWSHVVRNLLTDVLVVRGNRKGDQTRSHDDDADDMVLIEIVDRGDDGSGREVESCSQVLPTCILVAVAKRWRHQTRSHDDNGDDIEIVDRLDDCSGREVESTLANC